MTTPIDYLDRLKVIDYNRLINKSTLSIFCSQMRSYDPFIGLIIGIINLSVLSRQALFVIRKGLILFLIDNVYLFLLYSVNKLRIRKRF